MELLIKEYTLNEEHPLYSECSVLNLYVEDTSMLTILSLKTVFENSKYQLKRCSKLNLSCDTFSSMSLIINFIFLFYSSVGSISASINTHTGTSPLY